MATAETLPAFDVYGSGGPWHRKERLARPAAGSTDLRSRLLARASRRRGLAFETPAPDDEHPRGQPLLARLLHRQSMGAVTGRAAFPSHGLRSRNRLEGAPLPRAPGAPEVGRCAECRLCLRGAESQIGWLGCRVTPGLHGWLEGEHGLNSRLRRKSRTKGFVEAWVRPSDVKRVPDDFVMSGLAVEYLDAARDRGRSDARPGPHRECCCGTPAWRSSTSPSGSRR